MRQKSGIFGVSHFSRQKELNMAHVPSENEQNKHEYTDEELERLTDFIDVLIQIDREEKDRFDRLKDEPKGFSMPGEGRSCSLCDKEVYSEDGWYDKWGFKCLNCQSAVDKKKIPGSLCRDYQHKKSIPDTALAMKLGVNVHSIRKQIREGKITGRRIPNGPYMILRKDNANTVDSVDLFKK